MDGVFAAISHTWHPEGEGEPTPPKSCKRKHNENDAALKPTKKCAAQGLALKKGRGKGEGGRMERGEWSVHSFTRVLIARTVASSAHS